MTNHPNVLKFVGLARLDQGSIAMVSPWMTRGNLLSFVQEHNDAKRLDLVCAYRFLPLTRVNNVFLALPCSGGLALPSCG